MGLPAFPSLLTSVQNNCCIPFRLYCPIKSNTLIAVEHPSMNGNLFSFISTKHRIFCAEMETAIFPVPLRALQRCCNCCPTGAWSNTSCTSSWLLMPPPGNPISRRMCWPAIASTFQFFTAFAGLHQVNQIEGGADWLAFRCLAASSGLFMISCFADHLIAPASATHFHLLYLWPEWSA